MRRRLFVAVVVVSLVGTIGAVVRHGPGAGAATTATFTATADASVRSDQPNTNFGNDVQLVVDGSPTVYAYVKFAAAGLSGRVTRATLRVYTYSTSTTGVAASSTGSGWTEAGITYANRPPSGTALGSATHITAETWIAMDVTAAVAGNGDHSFAISTTSETSKKLSSRQGTFPPQLVVETDASSTTSSSTTSSSTTSSTTTTTTTRPPGGDPVIAAAGDIACGPSDANYKGGNGTATACRQKYTSNLLVSGGYTAVLTLGDNMQSDPSPSGFATVYAPTWGRVKPITHPEAGNHDYGYSKAGGYYGYFGAAAGDPTKGYYSWNVGTWHVIEINSNCTKISGGCAKGSAEELWVKADLAANASKACTLAVWHHPRYSSGHDGDNTFMTAIFQDLYDANADVVLSGHSHDYERFGPQDNASHADAARGITQFVVGTGGSFFTGFGSVKPNSQVHQNSTFGVLALTLHATGYDWRFVPEAGKTWTDSGSRSCH